MRKLLYTSFLLISFLGFGQCPTSDITFSTQAEVDAFAAMYPGCSQVTVNLTVFGNDIVDLNGLSQITSINGKLLIYNNASLGSLSGLGDIEFFGSNSSLSITLNPLLTTLANFSGTLNDGVFGLSITFCPNLTSLSQLENVTYADGLNLRDMPGLTSLSGLENMTIEGVLQITENENLINLSEFSGNLLEFFQLSVRGNAQLTGLEGLQGIQIDNNNINQANIIIADNAQLNNLDALSSITNAPQLLRIDNNPLLQSIQGLANISGSIERLAITENSILPSLNGLEQINNVLNELQIYQNDNLQTLDGLQGLTNTGNPPVLLLLMRENLSLNNIDGLNSLDENTVGVCVFEDNPELSICATQFVCRAIDAGVPFNLSNNGIGCNTITEIDDQCKLFIEEVFLENALALYPNPVSEILHINASEGISVKGAEIFSLLGDRVFETSEKSIDVSSLSEGIYFMQIETDQGSITRRFIVE